MKTRGTQGIASSLSIAIGLIFITGCTAFSPPGTNVDPLVSNAFTPKPSATHELLSNLPEPLGVIVAAVYSFRDQTGQFKPPPSNNLSTAVSQGADTILMKALLDTGWFRPVERTSLQNLLTERNISQSKNQETGGSSPNLPAVAPANVIIEGSVVAYDFNTRSGGAGAKILGIGSSQQYREDLVSINLRVVNIVDGVILHSVNSTKRIFSRQLNNGFFNFVDVDKILELEAGYSYNEPSQLAVVEAIETGLMNLVAEGIIKGTWALLDPNGIDSEVFDRFMSEADRQKYRDKLAAAENDEASALENAVEVERFGRLLRHRRFDVEQVRRSSTSVATRPARNTQNQARSANQSSLVNEPQLSAARPTSAGSTVPSDGQSGTRDTGAQPVVVSSVMLVAGRFKREDNATKALAVVADAFPESPVQLVSDQEEGIQRLHVGPMTTEDQVKAGIGQLRQLGFKRILITAPKTSSLPGKPAFDRLASELSSEARSFRPYWKRSAKPARESGESHPLRVVHYSDFLANSGSR